jgi:nitrogen-specific signal transduction histidine kinase
MEKDNKQTFLEKEFLATFLKELMPGILHNFANPLNGIMGRSKLLQRRIDAFSKNMREHHPEAADLLSEEIEKIKNDVRSINNESDAFFRMFRDISAKFYALAAREEERISLSQMLAAEMRFADFYLEFKHEITKALEIDREIPEIKGYAAELSLSFWRLIRFAMVSALRSKKKEFFLSTGHDHENIIVLIKYSSKESESNAGVEAATEILKQYSAGIQLSGEKGINEIRVEIPYHNGAAELKI